MNNENELIQLLKTQNSVAQKALFEKYSPKLLSVCRSYIKDLHIAEDCMIKAFMKIFKNISFYNGSGSFQGWMRKIMVNECLDYLKSNKQHCFFDEENFVTIEEIELETVDFDVQELLDGLPENYRTVFNLAILEDYSHKEIAELLQISEANSRQQLKRAKTKLKELFLNQKNSRNEIKA
jgi:RNA polymerase sigma-70 factor (ECF subfamily)